MAIFEIIQKRYAILGISSSHQLSQSCPFSKRVLSIVLLLGCVIVSHFVHIFRVADEFMEYVESICTTSGSIIVFVCLSIITRKKTTFIEIFDSVETILINAKCEYPESHRFLLKRIRHVERINEFIYTLVVKIFLQFALLPKFIVSFGVYFITDLGPDSFHLPFPLWFPFDWHNPIGYLAAYIFEYIGFGYEYVIIACMLTFGIASFLLAMSVTKEIRRILLSINDKTQKNELRTAFLDFIGAHSAIKQVVRNISDTFQPIIMTLFTWSLLAISAALLITQVEIMHHGNVLILLLPVINGVVGLATVFIACELSQRVNDAFDRINDTIEQFNWYAFPIEVKRMLPIIIANAQQPILLECFGSIVCTRGVFKNIINRAFSYFMVLRRISD